MLYFTLVNQFKLVSYSTVDANGFVFWPQRINNLIAGQYDNRSFFLLLL